MKTLSILACVALLGGCASQAQLARYDMDKCASYGFKPGTSDFARCRMEMDKVRTEDELASKREFHKKMRDEYIP